ncbi:MAG: hydroxysqualene dehydroxylase HpnE [Solirubrobacteraceae bacterium]
MTRSSELAGTDPLRGVDAAARGGRRSVTVVGGGLAGITAALDCAESGAQVPLLEVRPRLGGAAYSFERDGLLLDNGQHVFLRCCTAYRDLLERLGSASTVALQSRLEIPVLSPGREPVVLRRGALPAPLHLAGALARYPHLSPRERLSAARAARALGRLTRERALELEGEGCTLGRWLAERGQGPRALDALWDLVALPTLNVRAADASLALGAFVLQTGLLEHADAGDIGFHLRPLSETLGAPALVALREAGVDVRLGWRVEEIGMEGEDLVVRGNGCALRSPAVIAAVPHARAAGMLESLLGAPVRAFEELGSSPIVNVHVVYDRRVCEHEFAAGIGTPVQYVFDRTEAAGVAEGQYLAVSISGAQEEMQMSAEQLRERYLSALERLFPAARQARVLRYAASREHAATFAARPGVEHKRPAARTAVSGLALAGAWTDTGWPATLEGAVRSGHAAARVALESVARAR